MFVRLTLAALLLTVVTLPSRAQSGADNLIGAWERISWTAPNGASLQPPAPASIAVFTAEGFWSVTVIPPNRPAITTPLQDLSQEELLWRFGGVDSRYGTYSVQGTRITRQDLANVNPNLVGQFSEVDYAFEGNVLVLTEVRGRTVSRFRRFHADAR